MKNMSPAGLAPAGHSPPLRGINEANLSAKQQTSQTNTRVSCAHEHPGRSSGDQTPARKGAKASDDQHSTQAAPLTPRAGTYAFPKAKRIRKRAEFLKLQQVGRRRAGARFVVITAPRPGMVSRLGITASRRVGNAVVRNRVKRLVREFFRRYQHRIHPPLDVLVIARPSAASVTYEKTKQELGAALGIDATD